jgi:hypothetical protein
MRSNSLVRPPRSAESAAEILAEARLRLELAAVEYATSLEVLLKECQELSPWDPPYDCGLYGSDRAQDAFERIAQAVAMIHKTAQQEVELHLALSDTVSPYEATPGAYAEALWSTQPTAIGLRERAAQTLMGGPVELPGYVVMMEIEPGRGASYYLQLVESHNPLHEYQSTSLTDGRVALAKTLMIQYAIPLPEAALQQGENAVVLTEDDTAPESPALTYAEYGRAAFGLLAQRAANSEFAVPTGAEFAQLAVVYADLAAVRGTALHQAHGIEPSHVESAARSFGEAARQVDFFVEDIAPFADGNQSGGVTFVSAASVNQWQRSSFWDAYGRGVEGQPDVSKPLAWRNHGHSRPYLNNWYALDRTQLKMVGAVGALRTIEMALNRIAASVEQDGVPEHADWIAAGEQQELSAHLKLLLGDRGAEHSVRLVKVHFQGNPIDIAIVDWRVLGGGWPDEGRPIVVVAPNAGPSLPEKINSLRRGESRQAPRDWWSYVAEWDETTNTGRFEFRGSYSDVDHHAYVLWETCEGGDDAGAVADQDCAYELVDHFSLWSAGGVHGLGGSLGELFARVVERDADNPVAPLMDSMERLSDNAPRLDPEYISGNTTFEGAWQALVSRALVRAQEAREQLNQARSTELSRLQQLSDVATAYDFAEATVEHLQSEHERLAAGLCGASAPDLACSAPLSQLPLGTLGIVPTGGAVGIEGGCSDCPDDPTELAQPSSYAFDRDGLEQLRHSACCVAKYTRTRAGFTQLRLPSRVAEEWLLGETATGSFADVGGQMQEEYQGIYNALKEMELAYDHFLYSLGLVEAGIDGAQSLLESIAIDEEEFINLCCLKTGA